MNEPLFDGLTAVSAFLAIAGVLTLRPTDPPPLNVDRIKQRQILSVLLLTLSVGALLYRWIGSVVTVPTESRLGIFRDAGLAMACGFGFVAAILSVTATDLADRVKSFLVVAACGAIVLIIAAAWEWALLWISLLAFGCWSLIRITQPVANTTVATVESTEEAPREPGFIMLAATSILVLLLGTWQHVVTNESQRNTRSQRYSAWPRATALADAWERSGWVLKSDKNNRNQPDRASVELVSKLASREQRIALGLGAMLLVVAGTAWRQAQDVSEEHSSES